jgi:glycosyltransferase involved in cell wall biosynthesis
MMAIEMAPFVTEAAERGIRPDGADLDLSVVVPLYREEENVDHAVAELLEVLDGMPESAEVILVDDGSPDATGAMAMAWHERDPRVRVIQFRRNFGQTAAISAGFRHARGRVVVLMDGDQQNDPHDLPRLLAKMDEGYDVVSGWRKDRKDKLLMRRVPSMLANRLISRITRTELHDYGCTLKAYHSDVVQHLHLYGELHRFIPALAGLVGARVVEIPVNHRPRTRGTSKYGISRTVRVILDLLTVKFLLKYLARPMQFFGLLGLGSFLLGFCSLLGLVVDKAVAGAGLAERPLLILSVLLVILGVQFVSMGLLGELLTRIYHEVGQRPPYVIRRTAGIDLAEERGGDPVVTLAGQGPSSVTIDVDDDGAGLPERGLPGRRRLEMTDRLSHGSDPAWP